MYVNNLKACMHFFCSVGNISTPVCNCITVLLITVRALCTSWVDPRHWQWFPWRAHPQPFTQHPPPPTTTTSSFSAVLADFSRLTLGNICQANIL